MSRNLFDVCISNIYGQLRTVADAGIELDAKPEEVLAIKNEFRKLYRLVGLSWKIFATELPGKTKEKKNEALELASRLANTDPSEEKQKEESKVRDLIPWWKDPDLNFRYQKFINQIEHALFDFTDYQPATTSELASYRKIIRAIRHLFKIPGRQPSIKKCSDLAQQRLDFCNMILVHLIQGARNLNNLHIFNQLRSLGIRTSEPSILQANEKIRGGLSEITSFFEAAIKQAVGK